ncbi:MAG: ACT domain-containing protein, partial [Spirulina sp.]
GRELLEKELGKNGVEALLKSEPMQMVAERCNYQNVEDLLAALGYGEATLNLIVNRLRDAVKATQPIETDTTPNTEETIDTTARHLPRESICKTSPIDGVEGLMYHIAGCCNPIPGEAIIGVVTRHKGISIHRQGCTNVEKMTGDRLIPVSWNPIAEKGCYRTYRVNIQVETIDRLGVMRDILGRLSDAEINVCQAEVSTTPGKPALITLGIEIRDRGQLDRSLNKIRQMSDVLNVRRIEQ